MMNSNLVYTGRLDVKVGSKTYTTYNEGTIHLFKLISTILCSQQFNATSLPAQFMLYKQDAKNLVSKPFSNSHTQLLISPVDIQQRYSNTANIVGDLESVVYVSHFITYITPRMLISSSHDENSSYALALLNLNMQEDGQEILAAVSFPSEAYNALAKNEELQIEWSMILSNNTSNNKFEEAYSESIN